MLLQFGFRLLNINGQKLSDVAKLPDDELTDTSDLGRNGIRLGAEKLPGDVVKLLLPGVDLMNERRIRNLAQGDRCGEAVHFLLKLLSTVAHSADLVVQSDERAFQLLLKPLNGVFDSFGSKYGIMQFRKQVRFNFVRTLFQAIRASATLVVDWASVTPFTVCRTSGHQG
ncbi:MAG: hypothetical protein WDO73_36090 [Ignavibacteriota bacterium]